MGKQPEDEMIGAQGGLPQWLLQLQTPVEYQKTREEVGKGRYDWSQGGITSMVIPASNPSRLPEDNIKTNGVSYVTDCIAPARVELSAWWTP